MTTTTVSPELHLNVVKHLATGKGLDIVATLTHLDRATVLDIGSHHGYPDTEKLTWAVDILEKKLTDDQAPTRHPEAGRIAADEARRASAPREPRNPTATRVGQVLTTGSPVGLTRPDEIRVLINTAKGHPAKRIQAAGDKVIDAIDRLKSLIHEDQEKHAEKRRADEQRVAAKAEVERLTRELAAAREKLRGPKAPKPATITVDDSVTSAELREWARNNDIECPARGSVPKTVREAYEEAKAS